jgi:hypothetical protein
MTTEQPIEQLCGRIKADPYFYSSNANLFLAQKFFPDQVQRHVYKHHGKEQAIAYVKNRLSVPWDFFTNANHSRMLIQACDTFTLTDNLGFSAVVLSLDLLNQSWLELEPYGDDPTHDACQVLRKLNLEGELTNEQIKEWLL